METIDSLTLLLPVLDQYASDSYVSQVIKTTKNKIAQAEANMSQAKVRFTAEPLKSQVQKTYSKLDVRMKDVLFRQETIDSKSVSYFGDCGGIQRFIKSWHVEEYYNEAIEALDELRLLLPALEIYSSDLYVAETISKAKEQIATAEATIGKAKARFESQPLKQKAIALHTKLDVRHNIESCS